MDTHDETDFTPVPSASTRHDGWTPERQVQFIELLAQSGVVAFSARGVGKSAVSAYKLRARPGAESFAAAWDRAIATGQARAFDAAYDRAVNGITTPRYYRGQVIGTRHRYDYRLALAALSPREPSSPPRRGRPNKDGSP